MPLYVIGAGFGRTGTLSLKAALDRLGYKTHHFDEIWLHKNQAFAWVAAKKAKDKGLPFNWDRLYGPGGYTATVDWPSCHFYKELLQRYPDAKVILTVREFDAWYKSISETVYAAAKVLDSLVLSWYFRLLLIRYFTMDRVQRDIVLNGTFSGRLDDVEHHRKVYETHIEEVKRTVPADQLLVFHPRDGWAPLCKFLGHVEPQEPFPHANDTQFFKTRIATLKSWAAFAAVFTRICDVLLLVVLGRWLYRWALAMMPSLALPGAGSSTTAAAGAASASGASWTS